jgi:hypothetical protein
MHPNKIKGNNAAAIAATLFTVAIAATLFTVATIALLLFLLE